MENEFVTYTQALALKELGFDEPCFGYYVDKTGEDVTIYTVSQVQCSINSMSVHFNINNVYPSSQFSAPLKQQVFRWFRDEYKIETVVACFYSKRLEISYEKRQYHCHIVRDGITTKGPKFKTYEESESACIDKLIEIVKKK